MVDQGNHEELMENSPIYVDIYHSQLADNGLDMDGQKPEIFAGNGQRTPDDKPLVV